MTSEVWPAVATFVTVPGSVAGSRRCLVFQRSWLDIQTVTLRQVELWLAIPHDIADRWPGGICLEPIELGGWQQRKRIVDVYHVRVDRAPDYGMVQYEGIGRLSRLPSPLNAITDEGGSRVAREQDQP